MGHPHYSAQEICQRGQDIYDQKLRSLLNTLENYGKVLLIDIETEDYEIDTQFNQIPAAHRLLARHPGAALYGMRVGFPSLAKIGGGWGVHS